MPYLKGCATLCVVLSCFSRVQPFPTLWTTVARQAPLSVEFSRQEYWTGFPPGDLLDLEIKPMSLMSPAFAGGFFTTGATWEAHLKGYFLLKKKIHSEFQTSDITQHSWNEHPG